MAAARSPSSEHVADPCFAQLSSSLPPLMNSLYTLALRQSSSLQTDLTALEQSYLPTGSTSSTASLNGQINASLAALDRTVEDYDSMARREIVEAKRDKALR